jgi:hypothetical protein
MSDYERDPDDIGDRRMCDRCGAFIKSVFSMVHVDDGWACEDCATVEEFRRHWDQCERCGAEHDDDGGASSYGWIVESGKTGSDSRVICPSCVTMAEDVADAEHLLRDVDRGMAFCSAKGEEYPEHLLRIAERERARIARYVQCWTTLTPRNNHHEQAATARE